MQDKTESLNKDSQKKTSKQQKVHHYVRTLLAAFFGIVALSLILASILLVWANRMLTDTPTYVKTVAPLAQKPDVQKLVANKVTEALIKSNNTNDIANTLLTPEEINGKTPKELETTVRTVVNDSVLHVMASDKFAMLWKETNTRAHTIFIGQLKGEAQDVTLDLTPVVQGITTELKQTRLAPVADKISLTDGQDAKFDLKGGPIEKTHQFYDWLQKGTWVVLFVTVISAALAIVISVHHKKTARRILFGTGVISLSLAFTLQAASIVKFGGAGELERNAAIAIGTTVFRSLQIACLVIGLVCVGLAVASKIYDRIHTHQK